MIVLYLCRPSGATRSLLTGHTLYEVSLMISNTTIMNSINYKGQALTSLQKTNTATWKANATATLDAINATFRDVDAIWEACKDKLKEYGDKKTFAAHFCGKPGLSPSTAAKYLRVSRGVNTNAVDTKTGKRSPIKPDLHGRKFTQTDLNKFSKDVEEAKKAGTPTIFFAVAELGRWDDANRIVGVKPKPQKKEGGTEASSEEQSNTHGAALVSISHNGLGTLKESTEGEISYPKKKEDTYRLAMLAIGTIDKALKGDNRALFQAELRKRFEIEVLEVA